MFWSCVLLNVRGPDMLRRFRGSRTFSVFLSSSGYLYTVLLPVTRMTAVTNVRVVNYFD